nr:MULTISPECIES: lysophospholipid acyltransferase family protein [Rothia]
MYKLIAHVEITGRENLPKSGGYIIVANHTTELDPVTVAFPVFVEGALPRFLAKDSLFRAPVLGYIMRKLAHIPVVRGSVDARKSLITARKIVEAGGAVVIFPEGTTTHDPQLWPMQARTGAARLALATGAPVYPVAHWGDEQILGYVDEDGEDGRIKEKRKISLFPRKTVQVKVGKALDIASLVEDISPDAKHTRTELGVVTDAMLDAITAELEKIRGEKAPEGRWNPRAKRREASGTPSGPVGGPLGEPDEK